MFYNFVSTQDTSLPDELKAFEAGVVAGLGEKGAGVSLRYIRESPPSANLFSSVFRIRLYVHLSAVAWSLELLIIAI